MMKAMLSQPMAGKTDEEIIATREKAVKALTVKFLYGIRDGAEILKGVRIND